MPEKVRPFLWFNGTASAAAKFYTSIFPKSKIVRTDAWSTTFRLEGVEFVAFNGGPQFKFNRAISFMVLCKNQREVDYYWRRLSAGGKTIACGWLTDKFGVTWQIVPSMIYDVLRDRDPKKSERAMAAMLKMKKLNIAALRRAHAGPAK
jgi:predicted 3-demethylubiquinone-9 3-methyltransferase (glyoxalase superfamily)